MSTRRFVVLALGLLTTACQTTMSVEEARRVTAQFAGGSFIPPPRTVDDITAILDQQKRTNPDALAGAQALVDAQPPTSSDPSRLADFYHQRGLAAREVGRFTQELEDLSRAAGYARRMEILSDLSWAHYNGGNFSRARRIREEMLGYQPDRGGWQLSNHAFLARLYAITGDLAAAEAATRESTRLLGASRRWQGVPSETIASMESAVATAQASVAEARGRYEQAEAFYRESILKLAVDPKWSRDVWFDLQIARLALLLVRQGRLLEAENEARRALLGALSKRGRNSNAAANMLRVLARPISEQGRYAEAEALARASLDIYEQIGTPADSFTMALARAELAGSLVDQGRWDAAVAEYDAIGRAQAGDAKTFTFFALRNNQAIALLKTGHADRAAELLDALLAQQRATLGDTHTSTAETRGLLAAAHAARGERARALAGFAEATRVLLDRTLEVDDEATTRPAHEQRLRLILASYISLLAKIRGTPEERQAGIDAAAEAFRLAEVARGASVQRSLDAAAARAAAGTSALSDLVRREQDARKQISALYGLVASAMTSPDALGARVVNDLRAQIETLQQARQTIRRQLEREFPAYTQLINPPPMTLDQAQSRLRAGEALIAFYVDEDQTFVWAVPHRGPVAFGVAPLGRKSLDEVVTALRASLDPGASTLGTIPAFDVSRAHRLYAALLEPVAQGWRRADTLLIVAHGPLGQLPFGLLPTRAATLGAEHGPLFAHYRQVSWLIRSHAITLLPSVTALATLRALPPGDPGRRPFIGFGDPLFSRQQAAEAAREAAAVQTAAVSAQDHRLALRSSPKTQQLNSSRLAMLPRLPDTAEELRSIALALKADPTRDVFLGARANETTVKGLDLTRYRVLAFATHGLVPGDLDGLAQPALALSSPEVADVDGDGLLTLDEILGLRLNADWIVLSACNTASGQGAGSEALSGLGRAFFYAGARALLVSNWPVETTSARELTTDLFRRQTDQPRLTRSRALQDTINALIDGPGFVDRRTNTVVFSYAHPIFWAPFTLVGDGGGS
jgi:CHAT domain-containing protein